MKATISHVRNLSSMLAALGLVLSPAAGFAEVGLRVAGNFSQNKKHVDGVERPFFEGLAKRSGLSIRVSYNTMDALGVKAPDALRLLKGGTFDVMSVQIGMASRDDPFFEGLDLAGVATNMKELRKVVDAYREAFDLRLQKKFNAKAMTLWPFGPQMIYCKIRGDEFKGFEGLKVRVFTPSMSALIKEVGGTPVTLQFNEVYPALQRGVADCAVTAPTAGNSAKWPEVTTHFIPLAVSGSVQGHFMGLDTWKKFKPEEQKKLAAAFKEMEDAMWKLADDVNNDAIACNTGQAACKDHTKFGMKLVQVPAQLMQKVKGATETVVLKQWAETCGKVDATCAATWNKTAGSVAGLAIR